MDINEAFAIYERLNQQKHNIMMKTSLALRRGGINTLEKLQTEWYNNRESVTSLRDIGQKRTSMIESVIDFFDDDDDLETIYFAGGCLWGVQHFIKSLPGVVRTEAGRANGTSDSLTGEYDGYAECVKTVFDPRIVSVEQLMKYFFEIIDPYSVNKQGIDVGKKYRTGVYSVRGTHLDCAKRFIMSREDRALIKVEVLPLSNYIKSAKEHQDRLEKFPDDYCHIPIQILNKYRKKE